MTTVASYKLLKGYWIGFLLICFTVCTEPAWAGVGARAGRRRERRERAYGSVDIGWEYTGQDVTSVVIWKLDLIISDIIASE